MGRGLGSLPRANWRSALRHQHAESHLQLPVVDQVGRHQPARATPALTCDSLNTPARPLPDASSGTTFPTEKRSKLTFGAPVKWASAPVKVPPVHLDGAFGLARSSALKDIVARKQT